MGICGTLTGTFQWIPAAKNGPTMPSARDKISAFAYVEPRRDVEGAVLLRGDIPSTTEAVTVEGGWLSGYAVPDTRPGDVVVIIASQRPIARVTITGVSSAPSAIEENR